MALGGGPEDMEIKVTVDDSGAVQKIEGIDRALEHVGKTAEDTSEGFSRFQASIVTLNQGAELLGKAFSFALGAIPDALEAIKSGQDFNDVAGAFDNLTAKAGVLSDTLLNDLRAATAGTVTDLELMKLANEGLIAGLDPSAFEVITKAARSYADATGGDATQATEQFITALTKGNDAQLKALGLNIDNEAAIKAYASAHGVAADRLSELGKAEAIRVAALDKLRAQTENLGEATRDVGDDIDSMEVALTNLKDRAFAAAAENDELQRTIANLARAINSFDASVIIGEINQIIDGFRVLSKIDTSLILSPGLAIDLAASEVAAEKAAEAYKAESASLEQLRSVQDQTREAFEAFADTKKVSTEQFKKLEEAISALPPSLSKTHAGAALYNDILGKTKIQMEVLATGIEKVGKGNEKLPPGFIRAGDASKKAAEAAKKHAEELEALLDNISQLTRTDGLPELEAQFADVFATASEGQDLADALSRVAREAVAAGTPVDKVANSFENAAEAAEKLKEEAEEVRRRLEELQDGTLADAINNIFGADFAPGGFFGFDLSGLEASTEQAMASALEGALGSVASAFADGRIGKEESKQLVQAAGTVIGAAVGAYFGGEAGAQAGAAIGGFVGALATELLGDDSAGTKARKEADKFFADMFDANRLKIIVNGELRELYDLVFQGDTPFGGDNLELGLPGFTAFFDSLPEQAQDAFAGVGAAFEELLGVSDELAGQLGAVLANNIGGELNNLQLAIYATGYSLEQLSDALIKSLEKGNLSFAEAHKALLGLQEVMQDGIPGAVGDVTQAFANLQAAGSKGGIATVDAIKDIAFEAEELGFTTFPQIIQHLISTGQFTAEEINQVFDALAAAGITTIDQLQSATTEDLLPALAQLENQGFLTETLEQAGELLDKLNELPEKIETTVRIKYEYENGDASTLDRLSGTGGSGGIPRESNINYRGGGTIYLDGGGSKSPPSGGSSAIPIFQANQRSLSYRTP